MATPESAPEPKPRPDIAKLSFARHHAFIIGINAYENNISPLKTAVNDAKRLAEVLQQQHHFEVHSPLLNARGAQIRELLQTTMRQVVGNDDRVLFYFAGHGIAADGDDGPAGYIVPADAEPTDLKTFIAMADLQIALDELRCRHLLLILDCCFSGAFKWSSLHRAIDGLMPKRIYEDRFRRFVEDPARQIITSAAYDQKALDVLDGKATGFRDVISSDGTVQHSPFALALFQGLEGKADIKGEREGDGVITVTELYCHIRDLIEPATLQKGERLRQTPSFFPLRGHDKGEFMFLHPRHRLNLPARDVGQLPFKGLASFDESDKHLFYGRDRVIAELKAKADDPSNRLLVVVGASGTGKSSVIKAGLLPLLRDSGLSILPPMRPGAHPLAALARVLKEAEAGAESAAPTVGKAVLLIDQFEEVITRCADPAERRAFDERLRELLDEAGVIARIIITVRSDFEPQLNGGALKQAWSQGRFTVPPFSVDELREVIVMPTIQEVLIFDPPELVDRIIGEVVQSPGALPLLSYTLSELYGAYLRSGRSDRALRQNDYEKLGGVIGALSTKADVLFNGLDDASQNTLRKIMLRLVSVEGDLTGKRVPMDELDFSEADKPLVGAVLDKLIEARLIVRGRDETRGQDSVEPAHDALVRAWKTLHDWIHGAGKDKLILSARLNAAANDFAQSRDGGLLWSDSPYLPLLEKELINSEHGFNTREIAFIRKSVERRIDKAHEVEAQRDRALAELRRAASLRLVAGTPAMLTGERAGSHERVVQQLLAANSLLGKSVELDGALLVAVKALACQVKLLDTGSAIKSLAFSPDGRRIVSGGPDGKLRVWQVHNEALQPGAPIESLSQEANEILAVAFSPDGERIASAGMSGRLRLWNAKTGKETTAPENADDYRSAIGALAFSGDSTRIVTCDIGGKVQLWDSRTGEPVGEPLETYAEGIPSVAFSRDGKCIVSGGEGSLMRWKQTSRGWIGQPLDAETDDMAAMFVTSVAISPDGKLIAAASQDHMLRLWDVKKHKLIRTLAQHRAAIDSVVFSPDGKKIVSGDETGMLLLWDVKTGQLTATLLGGQKGSVTSLSFSGDGSRMVSGGLDGMLRVWDLGANQSMGDPLEGNAVGPERKGWALKPAPANSRFAFARSARSRTISPDGARMVLGDDDGHVRLWDVATRKPISAPLEGNKTRENPYANSKERQRLAIMALAFSRDGAYIVSGSQNGTLRLWKAIPLEPMGQLIEGHRGMVTAVALSPDGTSIVSGSEDGPVRLWDSSSGAQIGLLLEGGQDAVATVAFSPNGAHIAAKSRDGTLRFWPGPSRWAKLLCSKLTRNMSRQQWKDWVSPEIEYQVQCPRLPVSD